tara:strand:- start:28885 stop:29301 length:417 start_codon:yes stop_codon:yes gene_type:complete
MDPMTMFVVASAASAGAQAIGESQAQKQEAANMDAEARLADTQALQRDTQLRDELSIFMSSLKSARAANGLSSTSPNALLLAQNANEISSKERTTQTANDRQRAANLRAGAAGKRRGAKLSLITGLARAAVPIAQSRL